MTFPPKKDTSGCSQPVASPHTGRLGLVTWPALTAGTLANVMRQRAVRSCQWGLAPGGLLPGACLPWHQAPKELHGKAPANSSSAAPSQSPDDTRCSGDTWAQQSSVRLQMTATPLQSRYLESRATPTHHRTERGNWVLLLKLVSFGVVC